MASELRRGEVDIAPFFSKPRKGLREKNVGSQELATMVTQSARLNAKMQATSGRTEKLGKRGTWGGRKKSGKAMGGKKKSGSPLAHPLQKNTRKNGERRH